MSKIVKILGWENKGTYALVKVQLEHGDEDYTVYIGGDVETYFAYGRANAFVKKNKEV